MPRTFVIPTGTGLHYNVSGKIWTVGPRYILHEHVGGGSYGDVCRATDVEMNQTVALKRIPDVLCCPLLAKRVLREVCIMRRLSHPHIISLTDVFTYPSTEIDGGLDLYIATEYADRGDLYHLKEPLSVIVVKVLMLQLLSGLKYLHSCHVWHRDIKSENVLLTSKMDVKICDFGLSRSAHEAASGYEIGQSSTGSQKSFAKKILTRQYTKMVVTPSYRAPEVIMSRGQYNSTIDIWSLGCIFWELLIRSVNPQFRGPLSNPLFGIRGEPVTPQYGENYVKNSHTPLAEQLNVIFNVIGTPCWKDIDSIPSETWREYLKGLPGRVGNLGKNLIGVVEDEAIDLLSRMLTFDPSRRCTAEEALSHAYFEGIRKPNATRQNFVDNSLSAVTTGSMWKIKDPSVALEQLERELEASERDEDGGRKKLIMLLEKEIQEQRQQNEVKRSIVLSLAAARHPFLQREFIELSGGARSILKNVGPNGDSFLHMRENSKLVNGASSCEDTDSYQSTPNKRKRACTCEGDALLADSDGDLMQRLVIDDTRKRRGMKPLQFFPLLRRSPRIQDKTAGVPLSGSAYIQLR